MNSPILKDFSRNFSEIFLICFGFYKKKSSFSRALKWQLTQRQSDLLSRDDVYTRHVLHICVRVCMCACVRVHM